LGEYEDLDWKRALPPDDERKKKDFAKDVAAMANTHGGLIVFGVQESNEQAAGLVPVANTEPIDNGSECWPTTTSTRWW
jgi:predicted HTH transcriptional regulator